MHGTDPPAYCFYQEFKPRPPAHLRFDQHYLMYAIRGAIRLDLDGQQWALPPSYAAWIPANTPFGAEVTHPMTCCSVLFQNGFLDTPPAQSTVFPMTELAQDMIFFSRRWGPDAEDFDLHAETFFRALALNCSELARRPANVWRPMGKSESVRNAIAFTEANLDEEITLAQVAEAVHLSERSLARRFSAEAGMTWGQALRRLRMIRAIEILSNETDSIVAVAYRVGYGSLSAFNKAFRDFTGRTPSEFRAGHADAGSQRVDQS